jgi:hypothetical protein
MLTSTVGVGAVSRSGVSTCQGHILTVDIAAGVNTNQASKKGIRFIEIDVVGNNDIISFSVIILVDFDA